MTNGDKRLVLTSYITYCFNVQNMRLPEQNYVTEKVNNFILLDEASEIGTLTSHINVM